MDPDPEMDTPIALALAPLTDVIWDPRVPEFNRSMYIKSLREACAEIMHFQTFADFCDTRLATYFERLIEFNDQHGPHLPGVHPGWQVNGQLFAQRITAWVDVRLAELERFTSFVFGEYNLPLDVKIDTWDYQAEIVPNIRIEPIEYVLGLNLARLVHASIDSYKAMSKHVKREGVYSINEYVSHLDYVTNQDAQFIAYANLDGTMTLDDLLSFIDTADLDIMLVSQPVFAISYMNGFWEDNDMAEPLVWMGRGSNARRTLGSVYETYLDHPDFGFVQAPMWDLDEFLDEEQADHQILLQDDVPDPEELQDLADADPN